jgi:AraC family transcriptional regulator
MKLSIPLIETSTGNPSDYANTIVIQESSADLGWDGVLIERGYCTGSYPGNIVAPCFVFALEIDNDFKWTADSPESYLGQKFNPGEIWHNLPNVPFTQELPNSCSFIVLFVEERILLENFRIPENKKITFLKNFNIRDWNIENLIMLLYSEMLTKNRNGSNFSRSLIQAFSIYYVKNYSDYNDIMRLSSKRSKSCNIDIEAVAEYISRNIKGPISIEDLAEMCNASRFYFLKEFRRIMGITPYQYILKMKMDRAKELLMEDDTRVIDVAYQMGFSDQSHFTNTFKKYFGFSPGNFKKQEYNGLDRRVSRTDRRQ